jgi:PAS domain-containing protein
MRPLGCCSRVVCRFSPRLGTCAMDQVGGRDSRAKSDATPTGHTRVVSLVADAGVDDRRLGSSVYQAIFENSLDGVMFAAPDGRILAANDAACALLGMSEDEIIAAGRPSADPTTRAILGRRSALASKS